MENQWILDRADSVFEGGMKWDVKDVWQEIASKLDGPDILKLSATSQWFWETLMEDIVWKKATLHKLRVLDAPATINRAVAFPWFMLYARNFDGSHSYTGNPERHLNWLRQLGGFIVDSENVILTSEFLDNIGASAGEKVEALLQSEINFVRVTHMKPGIWVADLHEIMCICEDDCTRRMNTFDARHIELFATEEYRGGHCNFRFKGKEETKKEAAAFTTFAALFDSSHMRDAATLRVFDVPSWEGEESMVTPNGVAVKAHVGQIHHNGRLVFFYETIKISNEVLSIRVSFVA